MNDEAESSHFGEQNGYGVDLVRLRDAWSLTPDERIERSRRAAETVLLLRRLCGTGGRATPLKD